MLLCLPLLSTRLVSVPAALPWRACQLLLLLLHLLQESQLPGQGENETRSGIRSLLYTITTISATPATPAIGTITTILMDITINSSTTIIMVSPHRQLQWWGVWGALRVHAAHAS
mmetsp:Transcript_10708/g.29361  ORF Transcript_10708/g.29361 Transcript_10708/m.29361 type:complete len:115 (-) Transcript_10708:17-361(-)